MATRSRCRAVLAVAAVLLGWSGSAAHADLPAGSFVFNAGVLDVERHAGATYLAGPFSYAQPATGAAISVAGATAMAPGTRDAGFPEVVGTVHAVAADGSGGWYLGGSFAFVGGLERQNFAHVLGDGSVDPTVDVAFDGPVRAIVVSGGRVLVGGDFTHPVGVGTQRSLVALQDGAVDSGFTPDITTSEASVRELVLDGGALYVGGRFDQVGGQFRRSVARISPVTGAVDAAWAMSPVPTFATVEAIAVSGTTAYVGGTFGFAAPADAPYRNLSALSTTDGARVTAFDPAVDSTVSDLVVAAGRVVAGGGFTEVGGTPKRYFAVLDPADGALDATWPGIPSNAQSVDALAVDGDTLYVGGDFLFLGTSGPRLAAITLSTKAVVGAFRPEPNAAVLAIAPGVQVVAGGRFAAAGDPLLYLNGMARLNGDGSLDTDWTPDLASAGPAPQVFALRSTPAGLYVGGTFDGVRGQSRANLARLDAGGEVDPAFTAGTDGLVAALARDGDRLLVGGAFTTLAGAAQPRLGALLADGSRDPAFAPAIPGGDVRRISVAGGSAFVAGSFTALGGQPRPHGLGAVAADSGDVTAFAPDVRDRFGNAMPPGTTNDLEAAADAVHVVGTFGTIGGLERNGVAALDPATGGPLPFDAATPAAPTPFFTDVDRVGDALYVTGAGTTFGGAARDFLAVLDAGTGALRPYAPRVVPGELSSGAQLAVDGDLVVLASSEAGGRGAYGPAPGGVLLFERTPPAVDVVVPAAGATFTQGQTVPSSFSCDDAPAFTPAPSCTGPSSVDTSALGAATFSVTATDAQGNVTTREVPYVVVAAPPPDTTTGGSTDGTTTPAPTITPSTATPPTTAPSTEDRGTPTVTPGRLRGVGAGRVGVSGRVRLTLTCAGPGACSGRLRLTARVRSRGRLRTVTVLGATRYAVAGGRRSTRSVRLTAAGRAVLRRRGARVRARVVVPVAAAERPLTLVLRR